MALGITCPQTPALRETLLIAAKAIERHCHDDDEALHDLLPER